MELFIATIAIHINLQNRSNHSQAHQSASQQFSAATADDDCQSLFYDLNVLSDGRGIPSTGTVSSETAKILTNTHDDYKRLPFELYKTVVECMPIVCVDVICKRKSDNKVLLFYRRDKPASAIWWWPGGRMFRGETFYSAAQRKIKEETGSS
jgi:hypothetical protein